ncbi:MAG: chemotaxis protein CheW, partial [Solirubrobacteraceae bacterium]
MAAGDTQSEFERQLIVFSLHGEHYGLPIASVREIIRYTPPRVTATARGLIQGLINLRGRVLPVLDLSSRLGQVLKVSDATRILVLEVSGGVLGLIVDAVDGVEQVAANRIEPIPGVTGDALGDEISAIEDRLVMLIDPERALGRMLPGAAPAAEPAEPEPAPRTRAPEPIRAPRPSVPPPARRRSAATPQMPRPRRRPRHTGDSEE